MTPRLLAFAIVILLLGGIRNARATVIQDDCSGTVFLTSAALVTGMAIYDIATAPASARRYNQQHLAIRPFADPWHGSYGFSAAVPLGRARRPTRTSSAPSHRSPGAAVALSLGLTMLPMAAGVAAGNNAGGWTFLGGLVIGPSVGHVYAGQVGRGIGTAALRAGATAIGIRSIVNCFND